jgi:hypothetical protein
LNLYRYAEEAIFDDLVVRFERPDSKNRWDSPLFTLRPPLVMPPAAVNGGGGGGGGGGEDGGGDGCDGYNDTSREETLDIAVAMITGKRDNEVGLYTLNAVNP